MSPIPSPRTGRFTPLLTVLMLTLLLPGIAIAGGLRGIPVNAGDRAMSGIQPETDEDLFVLDAVAGGTLTVKLKPARGSNLIPVLAVLDPSGNRVDLTGYVKVKNGKTTLKKLPLTITGRWGISVAGGGATTGAYDLRTKAAWPKKRKLKALSLPAGESLGVTVPAWESVLVSAAIKDREAGGVEAMALLDPDGEEVPGAVDGFVTKKSSVKGKLQIHGGIGDRTLRIGNATGPTTLDVTLKFKYPKVLKRRLSISPLEPTATGTNPDSAWHGDVIAVFGTNFIDGPISVLFGDLPSPKVLFVSGTELRATVPVGEGEVHLIVTNPDGQWAESEETFRFAPETPLVTSLHPVYGPDDGGTRVTVSGRDMTHVVTVKLGGATVASGPDVQTDERLTFTTDAHEAGIRDLELIDRFGQVERVPGAFTFYGAPEIEGLSPRSGTEKGGTWVTVTGRWFRPESRVFLDGAELTSVAWIGTTSIGFLTPAHALGPVDLMIRDPWGREGTMDDAFEFSSASLDDVTDLNIPGNEGSAIYGGRALLVEDIDGDGDLDLLFGRSGTNTKGPFTSILMNDGSGQFSGRDMPASPGRDDYWEATDLALGDVDGDGDPDLVLTCEKSFVRSTTYSYFVGQVPHVAHGKLYSSTRLLLNDGRGTFVMKKGAFPDPTTPGTDLLRGSAIALGDVDGDKDLDIVITTPNSVGESTCTTKILASFVHRYFSVNYADDRPATRVLVNDGRGTFRDVTGSVIPSVEEGDLFAGNDVVIGDVDGDSYVDLVVTGDEVKMRDRESPQYVKGSLTRILGNDGTGAFTNWTEKFMPAVLDGDRWGGRGIWIGDLDGDKKSDDLIVTTDRRLSGEAESTTFHPSTRVFLGAANGFRNATADWLPHIRFDGEGDVHRGVATLAVNLSGDLRPSIFLVHPDPVYAEDPDTGRFDRRVTSLRWFRLSGEMPLANVSERLLPDPEKRKDWYIGHAMGFGDLDGDGDLELVITTEHPDYMKEGKRPTRILTLR